jgi:hypothetical protein
MLDIKNISDLLNEVDNGNTYVNLRLDPNGEIRGQTNSR